MVWLIVLAFPIFFGAVWVGIVSFLSWASGWRTLARVYQSELPETFSGKRLMLVTLGRGRFPRVHYRGMLWAEFGEDALWLKPHILFRWAHPVLAIPRSVITLEERKGLLRRFVELKSRADEEISFHLHPRQVSWIEQNVRPDLSDR
ncbi:hypothetical protein [Henriciella marina]|uniref:Uncharacterized protein n=1 Tax=Henriciella marina TaxID=453851 RepID=A0ABT4LWS0_9PROT|nr:hypothetical protein [Henriciella marina]MCZ4298825.1 hypothetical protein [Henriciella marina]